MRFKFLLLFSIFSIFTCVAFAQQPGLHFRTINQVGLTVGQGNPDLVLQSVNGFQKQKWFGGIGIGYDGYGYKTIPVFADLRREFGHAGEVFIYGNLGYHFPLKNKPRDFLGLYQSYRFIGGIYTDAGIGFQKALSPKSKVIVSLGHSFKEMHARLISNLCEECYPDLKNYRLRYGRLVLKAGLVF